MAFLGYRSAADRAIDRAHNRIANCQMTLNHSFSESAIAAAQADLEAARRYLARCEAAKAEWLSKPRGDYEEFPAIPETD